MKKCLVALLLLIGSQVVMAADVKIGVIDLRHILQTSPQVKHIGEKIKKDFQPREDKIIALQKELKKEIDKLKRDDAVMSDSARETLQSKVVANKRELKNLQQAFREDIMNEQNKAMQTFLSEVDGIVKDIAKYDNYDLILQREGVPYASNKVDISEQVIKALKNRKQLKSTKS